MIDRIVHHADVITLKGSSYRLKHTPDRLAALDKTGKSRQNNQRQRGSVFNPRNGSLFDQR